MADWFGNVQKFGSMEPVNTTGVITRAELMEDFELSFRGLNLEKNFDNIYKSDLTRMAFSAWVSSYETYAGYVRG